MDTPPPAPVQTADDPGFAGRELKEYAYTGALVPGFAMLAVSLALAAGAVCCIVFAGASEGDGGVGWLAAGAAVCAALFFFSLKGYFTLEPNEALVMIFFGQYKGTCQKVGFHWANPLLTRRKLSLRIRNMDIQPIKVNDKIGNPVMIGMVLVWKLRDTYRAVFDVDGSAFSGTLDTFVRIQSDAALREVTTHYAYDEDADATELTLRSGGDEISALLEKKINERVAMAGIEVIEARINYLAYAPEIAAVMLRRQQAAAIIAAREKIVEGAVGMVKMALDRIDSDHLAEFTQERRAAMVSNLLVVLCSDEPAQPVLPAGN